MRLHLKPQMADGVAAAAATRVLPRGSFPRVCSGPPAPITVSPSCRTRARWRCQDIELAKIALEQAPETGRSFKQLDQAAAGGRGVAAFPRDLDGCDDAARGP